jgi:hypothetical protein
MYSLNTEYKSFYILYLNRLYTENTIFLHILEFPVAEKSVLFSKY